MQLDVYGEVMGVASVAADKLGRLDAGHWPRSRAFVEHVERIWHEPDDGIWEARGPRRHYTQSKVMAWLVFDRAITLAERFGLDAPLDRWRQIRQEIHDEVCDKGYGRLDESRELFERLLGLTNDLGLLAEEYDAARQRQVGNFPQAFSHLALINAAANITAAS